MKVFGKNVINEILANPKKIKKIYISKTLKDKDLIEKIKTYSKWAKINESVWFFKSNKK